MKKIVFLMVAVLFVFSLIGCADTVVGPAGPGGVVGSPPNPLGDGVKSAKYIRLPGSIVSRGMSGAFTDPDESLCTEPESVYIFYADKSIVQYKPLEGYYSLLADAARLTCEIHNRDFAEAPWDYIAVNPPLPPPPVTSNDPVLEPLHIAFCDDNGVIYWEMVAVDNADYDRIVNTSTLITELERWNRDNDPDCHAVLGGRLP